MRVLLIEDRESDALIAREYLAEALEGQADVTWADRLAAGLDLLERSAFDVILLDLSLPDSEGLGTLERTREVAGGTPIVVMSGLADQEGAEAAVRSGAQDYVVKGEVSPHSLGRVVRYAIERQRLRTREQQRAAEIRCLYRVGEALTGAESPRDAFEKVVDCLPLGFRRPSLITAQIHWKGLVVSGEERPDSERQISATAKAVPGSPLSVTIAYRADAPRVDAVAFVDSEHDLLESVTGSLAQFLRKWQSDLDHRRLSTAIEQAGESVMITDVDGSILYVNPFFTEVTGYSRAEVLGKNPRFLKSGEHGPGFYEDLWETITGGGVWSGRIVNRTKDGSLITEEMTISPVAETDGSISSFVAVKRDVSADIERERQHLQSQKLETVGQLAGGVAHDFNNLLTVIHGNTEILLGTRLTDVQRDDIRQIRAAAKRASDLTRNLLTFSRRRQLDPQPTELDRLVRDFEKMLRRVIREDIELRTRYEASGLVVEVDRGAVEQALMNLVVNARDAISRSGTIEVRCERVTMDAEQLSGFPDCTPGDYGCVTVRDSGVGMDDEVLSRAFEPFYSTKGPDEGTGLGLATVYGVVRQGKGFVTLRSEPGKGTRASFGFPLLEASARPDREPSGQSEGPVGSEKILIVEDDPGVRRVVTSMVSRAGYEVYEASDGVQALAMLESGKCRPDLVVTDLVMPGMGGPTLANRLADARPGLPVVFMSGYSDRAVEAGLRSRAAKVIRKPFTSFELLRAVRRELDEGGRGHTEHEEASGT